MESKEKFIYRITQEILDNHGDMVDAIHIIDSTGEDGAEQFRIYHGEGYCFDLKREVADSSNRDNWDFSNLGNDGYYYTFGEYFDDFTIIGIDKAIELLNHYAGLKRK